MPTDPTPAPASPPPWLHQDDTPAAPGTGFPTPAGAQPRVRLSAVFGALASLLFLVSYALPWILVPEEQRPLIRAALQPGVDDLALAEPEIANDFRRLLDTISEDGRIGALDLFLYARTARRLNEVLETGPQGGGRPSQVRRAFLVGAVVLAALPVLSVLLALHFLAHRFRRARSPILILLVLAGGGGTAVALGWYAIARAFPLHGTTGIGMELALGASVAQACAGIFGVTSRNWWRVYSGAVALLGGLGVLAWAYVSLGAFS